MALAEQYCAPDSLLLSPFTSVDTSGTSLGMIYLDAKRAVRFIAEELRSRRTESMAEVPKVDDSIDDSRVRKQLIVWAWKNPFIRCEMSGSRTI